jgi:hypothetical protein
VVSAQWFLSSPLDPTVHSILPDTNEVTSCEFTSVPQICGCPAAPLSSLDVSSRAATGQRFDHPAFAGPHTTQASSWSAVGDSVAW